MPYSPVRHPTFRKNILPSSLVSKSTLSKKPACRRQPTELFISSPKHNFVNLFRIKWKILESRVILLLMDLRFLPRNGSGIFLFIYFNFISWQHWTLQKKQSIFALSFVVTLIFKLLLLSAYNHNVAELIIFKFK